MDILLNIIYFTWCLPQTALGLIIQIIYKVKDRKKYKLATVIELNASFGVSLGKYILIGSNNEKTIKHEYGHTLQNFIFGPLYLIIIGIPSVVRNILSRFIEIDYYKGYPERWADQLGGVNR